MPLTMDELPSSVRSTCCCNPEHHRWIRHAAKCENCNGWLYPARDQLPDAASRIAELQLIGVLQAYDTPQWCPVPSHYRRDPISTTGYRRKFKWPTMRLGIEVEFTSRSDELVSSRYDFSRGYAKLESGYAATDRREANAYCVYKADGSISGSYGGEFACIPATTGIHAAAWMNFPFNRVRVDESCGMHIHIDRRDISRLTVGKFHCFWNSVAGQSGCVSLMGRGPTSYCQTRGACATRLLNQNPDGMTPHFGALRERYSVVNHRRRKTIELRLPASPKSVNRLVHSLNAVEASCRFLKFYSVAQLLTGNGQLLWLDFMNWCGAQTEPRFKQLARESLNA